MSEPSLLRRFSQHAFSNIVAMLGVSCYIFADTFFISHGIGAYGLAALNFALVAYMCVSALLVMVSQGAATKYQIYISQGKSLEARQCFTTALMLMAGISALAILAGIIGTPYFVEHLGADEHTFELACTYMRVLLLSTPIMALYTLLRPFVRNDHAPQLVMAANVTSALSNIFLDWLFIYPLDLGMFGAAFATAISPAICLAILSLHIFSGKARFLPLAKPRITEYLSDIVSLGLASFLLEISSAVLLAVFNLMIMEYGGSLGVAAYGVVANLAFVATCLYEGLAQAIQPLASELYARRQPHALRQLMRYSAVIGLSLAVLIVLVACVSAPQIASLFNRDAIPELQYMAVRGLRIYFWGYFFAGANILIAAFLSSVEWARPSWIISLLRGLIATLAAAWVLSQFMGMLGMWLAFPVGEAATLVFSGIALAWWLRRFNPSSSTPSSTRNSFN